MSIDAPAVTQWRTLSQQLLRSTQILYPRPGLRLVSMPLSSLPKVMMHLSWSSELWLCSMNLTSGLINTFGVHLLRYLNNISVWWHAVGTTAVIIAILAAAPSLQNAHFVFSTFIDNTGLDGVGWSERASPAYVVVIGILMAQYTLTGKLLSFFSSHSHLTWSFRI